MKESQIQSAIMDLLLTHPKVAWAYVTTTGKVKGRGGHWMTLGFPGMSDILGQLKDGRLLAIEVKQPGEKPTEIQMDFILTVTRNKGVAGWATDVEHAVQILEAA